MISKCDVSLKTLADRQLHQKSFQILQGQFQVHLWFWDERIQSECVGWPADKQAETNTNLMQSGSEPPLERGEKLDTELMLQPISSCIQHCSYCSHCQVSGVLSLLRVALAFHISSPTPRYLPDPSAWKPLPCSFPSLQLESPRRTQPDSQVITCQTWATSPQLSKHRRIGELANLPWGELKTWQQLVFHWRPQCLLTVIWCPRKKKKTLSKPPWAITFQPRDAPVGPSQFQISKEHPEFLKDLNKIPWVSAQFKQFALDKVLEVLTTFGCNTSKQFQNTKLNTTEQPKMHTQFPTRWAADVFPKPLKSKPSERSCQMTKERHQDSTSTHTLKARHESLQQLLCTHCCKVQVPTQPWGLPKPSEGKASRFMKSHIQILKKSADK